MVVVVVVVVVVEVVVVVVVVAVAVAVVVAAVGARPLWIEPWFTGGCGQFARVVFYLQ